MAADSVGRHSDGFGWRIRDLDELRIWRIRPAAVCVGAGVGFLIFLTVEGVAMIFAQIWKDGQLDRAERQAEGRTRVHGSSEALVAGADVGAAWRTPQDERGL